MNENSIYGVIEIKQDGTIDIKLENESFCKDANPELVAHFLKNETEIIK